MIKNIFLKGNFNNIYSILEIVIYRCQDKDEYKTLVPDNCASPEEIDEYVLDLNNLIDIKVQVSQYNITSHQMQVSYKHLYQFMGSPKQVQSTELIMQKQVTSVKQGSFIQSESQYSSPISYIVSQNNAEKTIKQSNNCIFLFILSVDETILRTQIQYATFPEILAQCNSAITLLMSLGFLGKFMAKKLIRQEIFILILKTLYQETYQKILRLNDIQHFRDIYPQQINFSPFKSDYALKKVIDPIIMPSLETNSGEQILTQQGSQINRQIDDTKEQSVQYFKKKGSTDKKYLEIETDKSLNQLETRNERSRSNLILHKQVIKNGQRNNFFSYIQQNNTIEQQKQEVNSKLEIEKHLN